jgi:hypothetical protein
MRGLEINKVYVYYAMYGGIEDIKDPDGNSTGETRKSYGLPVKIRIRVSPNKGEVSAQYFGSSLDYDSAMVTNENLPIDEYSILWIGRVPTLENGKYPIDLDGNLLTGHTHVVVRVAKDIDVAQYAIKKLSVG